MFADKLKYSSVYAAVNERVAKGLEYIQSTDLKSMPDGKYPIDGSKLWLLLVTYDTKDYGEAFFEGHKNLIEVHTVITGAEKVFWSSLDDMYQAEETEEQVAHDKYYFMGEPTGSLVLDPGYFVCFLPEDVHMTKVEVNGPATIRKAVLKIAAD